MKSKIWTMFFLILTLIIIFSYRNNSLLRPVLHIANTDPPTYVSTPVPTVFSTYRPFSTTKISTATPSPTMAPDWSWHITFLGTNTSLDDLYSNSEFQVGDTVYFHAKLTGGAPNEKIHLCYEVYVNGDLVDSSAFSEKHGNDSLLWIRNTPQRYGVLSVRIYYYENSVNAKETELGIMSVNINARDNATESEISKGWISECDTYCDSAGTFIFDLGNYEPSDDAIIYFARNDHDDSFIQGTITNGLIVWDTLNPGWIYDYAIWSGSPDYANDASKLSQSQIPQSAWISVSVSEDHQISIISSTIPIHVLPNMQ